jgi:hypothetical protein
MMRTNTDEEMRMMRRVSYSVLVALLALCGAASLHAQVTTGSISGLVTDESGDTALPGAQVDAVYTPTGTVYSVVTQADGRFKISGARAGGPYKLTVNMDGFETGEADNIFVQLGDTTYLTFGLQLAGVTDVVTVVGTSSDLLSSSRSGGSSNVGEVEIQTLPTIGRGLDDFARSNPFFAVGSENEDPEAISVAGRSSRYNNIQIDGAVNNDLFGLADTGTPGGQADATPISLDAIQEVQLVLAPFDVRQGGFTGGGINAITRSGTNSFKGSVYYFTRDDGFVGDGPEDLGEFGTFEEDNYGFRVGGPIKKDKAFFFVNFDTVDQVQPTGWSIDGSGGQTFANGQAVDEANAFRDALISRYGFDPGDLGQNSRDTPSDRIFARFDFNINDNNQLTFRHNFVEADNDINRPGSFSYEWPSETYAFANETNSTVLQLNTVVSSTKFNEARLTFQSIEDTRAGRNGIPFPWIEIENVIDFDTGVDHGEFEAGTEPFSTRNGLDQDILEITNDFTMIKGNHTITIGTHNELFTFDNLFVQNAFGSYEFRTLEDFLNDAPSREYEYAFVNEGQSETQNFDVNQIGLYAGDQWSAKPNLTLTFGLRVDIPFFPDDPSRNPFTEETYGVRTDNMPDGEQLWSPRFGFNWDIGSQGKQQLRGGAGIFSGRTPYVWMSNQYARTGIEQTFIRTFVGVPFNPDPFDQPSDFPGGGGEFNLIDESFNFPTIARVNLGYDRELPWWNLFLSVEGIISESQEEIDYKDLNLIRDGGSLPFDGRPTFTRLDPNVSGAYLITNTSKGSAENFAIKLERRPGRGVWGSVSWAYGQADTVNDGTSSRAVSNFQFNEQIDPNNAVESPSDFQVEHRFNAAVGYSFNRDTRYPTTVSAFYNAQSGRPFSNIYGFQVPRGGINGDSYFSNDLLYVPSGPDDVVLTNGSWELLDAYINQDDCLNSHRGGIAPRNCSEAPWIHSMDIRIAQDIPIKQTNLQLTFDLFNLANFLDDDSGVLRYVNFNTVSPVDFIGTTDDGRPIYDLNNIVLDPENNDRFQKHNINSRWRAKLGARLTF